MSTMIKNSSEKHFKYIDIYGNNFVIFKGRNGKINFTLCHPKINEGSARQEFANISMIIRPESGKMFEVTEKLYEIAGNSFVISEDSIRDGRNYLLLEQETVDSYYLTVGRDLANDLNRPTITNIEVSGPYYEDFYSNIVKTKELSKKLSH